MKNLEPEHRMNDLPRFIAKLQEVFGTTVINIKNKTILVIRELDLALMLAVNNKVIYVTDDAKCAEIFRKNTAAGMGNDDVVIFINKWSNKLKFKKVTGKMKFDCAILNPPYDRNLHLKILEQVIPMAEKVVNISPVRWLQDPFAPYSTRSDYCKFEDSISKKIESLDVIPAKDASKLFDASFTMNLGIYVCGQGGYNYQHNDPLVTKIVEKTMEHSWAPFGVKIQKDIAQKEYILRTAEFSEILMNKTYDSQLKVKETTTFCGGRKSCVFSFNTEEERKNFYTCYCHPFMIWHTKLWKSDVHMYNEKVPYFSDYTHPWDYADFFAWFELTEEEQARVMREIAEMQAE